jgi:hypothetical protein
VGPTVIAVSRPPAISHRTPPVGNGHVPAVCSGRISPPSLDRTSGAITGDVTVRDDKVRVRPSRSVRLSGCG